MPAPRTRPDLGTIRSCPTWPDRLSTRLPNRLEPLTSTVSILRTRIARSGRTTHKLQACHMLRPILAGIHTCCIVVHFPAWSGLLRHNLRHKIHWDGLSHPSEGERARVVGNREDVTWSAGGGPDTGVHDLRERLTVGSEGLSFTTPCALRRRGPPLNGRAPASTPDPLMATARTGSHREGTLDPPSAPRKMHCTLRGPPARPATVCRIVSRPPLRMPTTAKTPSGQPSDPP
jgi:hypothetical protein